MLITKKVEEGQEMGWGKMLGVVAFLLPRSFSLAPQLYV